MLLSSMPDRKRQNHGSREQLPRSGLFGEVVQLVEMISATNFDLAPGAKIVPAVRVDRCRVDLILPSVTEKPPVVRSFDCKNDFSGLVDLPKPPTFFEMGEVKTDPQTLLAAKRVLCAQRKFNYLRGSDADPEAHAHRCDFLELAMNFSADQPFYRVHTNGLIPLWCNDVFLVHEWKDQISVNTRYTNEFDSEQLDGGSHFLFYSKSTEMIKILYEPVRVTVKHMMMIPSSVASEG